jgi:Zn-dependent protease/CBS domain-containing protein
MQGSIHVGSIAGMRIDINYGWLIILVLATISLAAGWFPEAIQGLSPGVYYILGFSAAILLFLSVLAHELAHVLVARACGLPVKSVTLFIFGGVSDLDSAPRSAGTEFLVAAIGPVVSLIIGTAFWLLAFVVSGYSALPAAILTYIGLANVLLGLLNLVPAFPLDGGRVLRSILWRVTGDLRRSTHWAARLGQVIAVLFIFWGIVQALGGNLFSGVWLGFIGWFLLTAARSADASVALKTMLRDARVADAMRPIALSAPPTMSLQEFVENFLPPGVRTVPVVQREQVVGLITVADVERIPRSHWEEMPVGNVMIPLARLRAVAPEESLTSVLPLVSGRDMNQLPVAQHGRVVGVISREAIMSYVEARHRPEAQAETQDDQTWEYAMRSEKNRITAPLPTQPQMQTQPQPSAQTQTQAQDTIDRHEPV